MNQEKLIVLGSGESGVGAAILAKKQGFDVFLSDCNEINKDLQFLLKNESINWEGGRHSIEKMKGTRLVVKSPGIPQGSQVIQTLIKSGSTIISEIEFASQFTSATLIGITGTNGKTTTTLLTYEILKKAGLNVGIAGNIGKSFALQVAQANFDYYVLEISSFQLDNIQDFAPHITLITNITPDHLDRYNYSLNKYKEAKLRITENQTSNDFFLFNAKKNLINLRLIRA